MFHNTDNWMQQRLGSQLSKSSIRCGFPSAKNPKKPTLWYQLRHIQPHAANTAARRMPLVFAVDYLIFATATTQAKRHELLGRAAICIAEDEELSFVTEPIPSGYFPPTLVGHPYLHVRTLWRHERPAKPAPAVTTVDIESANRHDVSGTFIDPHGKPMAREIIQIPTLGLTTLTNTQGQFHFRNIHHQPGRELILHMRGREWKITPHKRPVTIHFTPKES